MANDLTKRASVQVVMLASAALSATYYAAMAPPIDLAIAGLAINPAAIALGVMAAALDLFKPQAFRIAGTAGLGGVRRIAAGAVFLVLFFASMIAVDGVLMRLRSDASDTRARDASTYASAKAERDRLAGELAKVATARTTSEVRADMDRARVPSSTWSATRECTDADLLRGPVNAAGCKPILDLRQEMAAAIRKADVERDLAAARARLDTIEGEAAPPRAADPQAHALAGLLGWSEASVAYGLIALLGFALEIVACLGVWLLARPTSALAPAAVMDGGKVPGPVAGLERLSTAVVARGGRLIVENAELAAILGVSPGCASKWRRAWREAGEIVESRADGRLVIELGRRRLRLIAA